jgi:hypothetical protein
MTLGFDLYPLSLYQTGIQRWQHKARLAEDGQFFPIAYAGPGLKTIFNNPTL